MPACVNTHAQNLYLLGCSSPLGGGIKKPGWRLRYEFPGPDLPETLSLCGLHIFRVATHSPGPEHTTHSCCTADETPSIFYRTHAFYLYLLSPAALFPFPPPFSRSHFCFHDIPPSYSCTFFPPLPSFSQEGKEAEAFPYSSIYHHHQVIFFECLPSVTKCLVLT